ncbi:MAG: hypothetical protein HYT93_04425 [Parcubacteria group bacterium]|nr:hypothetical protein [Parcubacteria group bacterium]
MKQTRNQRRAFGRFINKHFKSATRIIRVADGHAIIGSWLARLLLRKSSNYSLERMLPLKHLRLQELAHAGFNCADFRFWLRNELSVEELTVFFARHGRISLRNFTEEDPLKETPKLPVAYDVDSIDTVLRFCNKHNENYHTLVNEALPLKDSLLAGNIVLLDNARYLVSYFKGYGTPRDVDEKTSELHVFLRRFGSRAPDWAPESLRLLGDQLASFRSDFRPMTIEFSLYPYPVGVLKRSEVLWEWRGGSTHDLYTVIASLLEKGDSHELKMTFSDSSKIV